MGTHKKCRECGKSFLMNDPRTPPEKCPFCGCSDPTTH